MNASLEAPNELTVTDQSFYIEVLSVRQPVLVGLWVTWCEPCRMIASMIRELAVEYASRAKMVKLDVDDNPEAAKRFAVSSFPTMLIFKDGQLADPIIGLTSKKMLTGKLDAQLN